MEQDTEIINRIKEDIKNSTYALQAIMLSLIVIIGIISSIAILMITMYKLG